MPADPREHILIVPLGNGFRVDIHAAKGDEERLIDRLHYPDYATAMRFAEHFASQTGFRIVEAGQ